MSQSIINLTNIFRSVENSQIIQPSNLFNQSNHLPAFEKLQLISTLSIQFICTWNPSLVLFARQLPKVFQPKPRLGLSRYKLSLSITTTNYQLCPSTQICRCHPSKLNFKSLWMNMQLIPKLRILKK